MKQPKAKKRAISQKCDTKPKPPGPKKKDLTQLTAKEAIFVAEYLANGFNGTKAAGKAGFSVRTADSQASRLLKKPRVKAAIDEARAEKLANLEITGERVLREIGQLAFADRSLLRLSDDGYGFEVKAKDKLRALELLGRNQKLFVDKVEHEHTHWIAELSDEELEAKLKAHGVQVGPATTS